MPPPPSSSSALSAPLPAADFLPHRPPLLWVDSLLAIDDHSCRCAVSLGDRFLPFLDKQHRLPAHFLLEIIAQSIGVWAGWHDRQRGIPPQSGMLLSCRNFSSAQPHFTFGDTLEIQVEKLVQDQGTGSFEGKVFLAKPAVAQATLTTYQTAWENLEKLLQRPALP